MKRLGLTRQIFRFPKFRRDENGTAIVEAAIALPVLIVLMIGGLEFARGLVAYVIVDKGVRAATRYLTRVPAASVCSTTLYDALTRARNVAMRGTQDTSGSLRVAEWTDPNSITCSYTAGPPALVQLQAAVPYNTGLLGAIGLPTQLTLTVSHQERHIGE